MGVQGWAARTSGEPTPPGARDLVGARRLQMGTSPAAVGHTRRGRRRRHQQFAGQQRHRHAGRHALRYCQGGSRGGRQGGNVDGHRVAGAHGAEEASELLGLPLVDRPERPPGGMPSTGPYRGTFEVVEPGRATDRGDLEGLFGVAGVPVDDVVDAGDRTVVVADVTWRSPWSPTVMAWTSRGCASSHQAMVSRKCPPSPVKTGALQARSAVPAVGSERPGVHQVADDGRCVAGPNRRRISVSNGANRLLNPDHETVVAGGGHDLENASQLIVVEGQRFLDEGCLSGLEGTG